MADVGERGEQAGEGQARLVEGKVQVELHAGGEPQLGLGVGGKGAGAGAAGLAVEGVVGLGALGLEHAGPASDGVGGGGIVTGQGLPAGQRLGEGRGGQPAPPLEGLAVEVAVGPLPGGQRGQRQVAGREAVGDDRKGPPGGVAVEELGEGGVAEQVAQGPAQLAEEGVAGQRRAEGGQGLQREAVGVHGAGAGAGKAWTASKWACLSCPSMHRPVKRILP